MANRIPNMNDILSISEVIRENSNGIDLNDMEIVFKVGEEDINRVNDDFYYRNNPEGDGSELTPVDEIEVHSNGIKFKYVIKKAGE